MPIVFLAGSTLKMFVGESAEGITAGKVLTAVLLMLTGFGIGYVVDYLSSGAWKNLPEADEKLSAGLVVTYFRWYFYWGWPLALIGIGGLLLFLGWDLLAGTEQDMEIGTILCLLSSVLILTMIVIYIRKILLWVRHGRRY